MHQLANNKGMYYVFNAYSLYGEESGELRLYYAPSDNRPLTERDIIASYSSSHEQGNKVLMSDAAFEDKGDKVSNILICPYFEISLNKEDYVLIYNDLGEEISYNMRLRSENGEYELIGEGEIG